MGIEISVEGLTKSFGRQVIWEDVSLTLPAGEISVMLGKDSWTWLLIGPLAG